MGERQWHTFDVHSTTCTRKLPNHIERLQSFMCFYNVALKKCMHTEPLNEHTFLQLKNSANEPISLYSLLKSLVKAAKETDRFFAFQ